MKAKLSVCAFFVLLAIAVQLPAQQTVYFAPANTDQQALDKFNQSARNLAEGIRRNREIRAQQEQYEREMRLREQQAQAERYEREQRMAVARRESERQQTEINRKRIKREAYEKVRVYFESESLDAVPKLVSLRQKIATLEAKRTTKKEIR